MMEVLYVYIYCVKKGSLHGSAVVASRLAVPAIIKCCLKDR